jgi:hypothetical protein
MVAITKLALVDNPREIATSHLNFIREAAREKKVAKDLIRRTHYWVYDSATKTFSPSKFSGYVGMDFQRYNAAREGNSIGIKFDSGVTQQAITKVLGDYQPDRAFARELQQWVRSIFGEDALEGIDSGKWRFVCLPAAVTGGLAALAGGWEGSDELVENVLALRRTPGRGAPEME